eukprot:gene11671-biopygen1145
MLYVEVRFTDSQHGDVLQSETTAARPAAGFNHWAPTTHGSGGRTAAAE